MCGIIVVTMGKEQKPGDKNSGNMPGAFDTPEVEEILAGFGTGSPGCVKSCIVPFCDLRDRPGSKEAGVGCPLMNDDDGVPFKGAF
jgi:hypothetical protein